MGTFLNSWKIKNGCKNTRINAEWEAKYICMIENEWRAQHNKKSQNIYLITNISLLEQHKGSTLFVLFYFIRSWNVWNTEHITEILKVNIFYNNNNN